MLAERCIAVSRAAVIVFTRSGGQYFKVASHIQDIINKLQGLKTVLKTVFAECHTDNFQMETGIEVSVKQENGVEYRVLKTKGTFWKSFEEWEQYKGVKTGNK